MHSLRTANAIFGYTRSAASSKLQIPKCNDGGGSLTSLCTLRLLMCLMVCNRGALLSGQRQDLRLPPLTRDLEIDYTALSFVVPQKVLFRYRLDGRDSAWQEPGTRRQAFYSDLRPGRYRFRVIACNNDGVWNEA